MMVAFSFCFHQVWEILAEDAYPQRRILGEEETMSRGFKEP